MFKQLHYFKSWLLLMLCTFVGASSAWAEDVTIGVGTSSITWTADGNNYQATSGDFTLRYEKGSYTNSISGGLQSKELRLYSGTNFVVSSTKTITKIVYTVADGSGNNYSVSALSTADGHLVSGVWTGSANSVSASLSAQNRIKSVTITYEGSDPSDTRTSTAVTIDASGITNTNVFNGTAAGSLSATVKAGETTVDGASVSWSSDDTGVATIDATGAVTLVGAGSTVITASYAGDETNYKPSSDTYTLTVTNADPSAVWVKVDLADLKASDVFVIVGNNGSNYALSNDKGTGSAPSAVAVTVDGNNLTGTVADNIKWKISGNATDGYTFYPNGSTDTWLYCTNTNNGVRVGTNDNKTFEIKDDYLYNKGTSRYIGVYNSEDWRCYTSINSNIKDQSFAFYKKPSSSTKEDAGLVYATTSYEVNLGESFTAPELTNPNNLTVTYASTNTDVATVEASTGAVTLAGAGSTVITASFAGDDTYEAGSASYTLTVVDPNAPGTENNPYTVAQAIDNTPSSGTSANVYIKGIVSQFFGADITDDNYHRYYISDDGTTSTQLLVFGGKGLNDVAFSSADDLLLGDEVVIVGQLKTYSNAPEVAGDNYIVTLNRKTLSSITLSGTYATSFVEGSEFNHDGVVVTARYSDQTTADVTSQAEFSTPDMTQVGEQTVTVSYGGKSTSYNITITEAPTHTATFSVNGTTSTEDFKEGAAITFPSVTAPTGYTFMGWTETAISTTQETAPADLTSSTTMGNADITYYAVFAVGTGSGEDTYEQLTSQSFDANATYVIAGKQSSTVNTMYYLQSYGGTDEDVNWGVATTTPATATPVQFTLSGTASALVAQDNSGNYLTCFSAKKFAMSSTSTTVYLDEDGAIKSASDGNLLRYNYNSGNGGFRWYAGTTGTQAYFYKVIPGTTYSDYCTTIQPVAITITSAGAASFSSTKALDFSNVEGLKAYKATSKSDSYVHLDEVAQVPAGAGVIVKGAEGTYNVPVATGDVAALDGNLLVGTAEAEYTVGDDYGKVFKYVKTNTGVVGFQKAKEGWTCQVGHAYLYFPETQAREFIGIFDEDISTGIEAIDNSQLTMDNDAPAYNLAGQKVGKGYKGIVVKNGKKVVK